MDELKQRRNGKAVRSTDERESRLSPSRTRLIVQLREGTTSAEILAVTKALYEHPALTWIEYTEPVDGEPGLPPGWEIVQ